jgi:hypothetical protein
LTRDGHLDSSFGTNGLVDLSRVDVCGLEPARSASPCTQS